MGLGAMVGHFDSDTVIAVALPPWYIICGGGSSMSRDTFFSFFKSRWPLAVAFSSGTIASGAISSVGIRGRRSGSIGVSGSVFFSFLFFF